MKTTEALMADHGKVVIKNNLIRSEETRRIRSCCVEKESELMAGRRPTIPGESPIVYDDGNSKGTYTGQCHMNSDEFASYVRRGWKRYCLFGSDTAKDELKKPLEGDWIGGIVEILQTCIDTLTDRQMMKVRENFQK